MSKQTRKPEKGDTVASIKTNMGEIKLLLFPDAAPKTVDNFRQLAEKDYYNGVIFHRVIPDFMIQGGDPTGTGMGGESAWGTPFDDEFDPDYHNICGALCMANAGPGTNGSQFFIVQLHNTDAGFLDQMSMYPDSYPPECIEDYEALGGTPWLDYHHTVFGQVYDGMTVVDDIAAVEKDSSDKPLKDVIIEKVTVEVV